MIYKPVSTFQFYPAIINYNLYLRIPVFLMDKFFSKTIFQTCFTCISPINYLLFITLRFHCHLLELREIYSWDVSENGERFYNCNVLYSLVLQYLSIEVWQVVWQELRKHGKVIIMLKLHHSELENHNYKMMSWFENRFNFYWTALGLVSFAAHNLWWLSIRLCEQNWINFKKTEQTLTCIWPLLRHVLQQQSILLTVNQSSRFLKPSACLEEC